jgi:restriction endonuclease S subunit
MSDEFPDKWTIETLGDLVCLTAESGIPMKDPSRPFIGMEDVESNTGRVLGTKSPLFYSSSSYIVHEGQVLYGRLRPYLNKVFMPTIECYASREFIPIFPGERLNAKFLFFCLTSSNFVEFAISLNTGDRPRVKWPQMSQYQLPLPPLAEQQRIVEILEEQFSRLDDALACIRKVREKTRAFRTSLLQAAFSGSLSNEFVKFEPVALQDLVDAKTDITDGPFGSNLKSEHYTTSGPRVVRLANISSGSFINSFVHISTEHFATLQKHRVLAGDVLVATLGESIPRACIAPEYLGDAIVKADCIRIRPSRRVNPSFLSYAINSPIVRVSAASMIQGVTRPRINLGTLRTTVIPLPPLEEQCRITELIEEQFSRLDDALEITNQLELRIATARRSLLHAAFSGTLTAQWRDTHNG